MKQQMPLSNYEILLRIIAWLVVATVLAAVLADVGVYRVFAIWFGVGIPAILAWDHALLYKPLDPGALAILNDAAKGDASMQAVLAAWVASGRTIRSRDEKWFRRELVSRKDESARDMLREIDSYREGRRQEP